MKASKGTESSAIVGTTKDRQRRECRCDARKAIENHGLLLANCGEVQFERGDDKVLEAAPSLTRVHRGRVDAETLDISLYNRCLSILKSVQTRRSSVAECTDVLRRRSSRETQSDERNAAVRLPKESRNGREGK